LSDVYKLRTADKPKEDKDKATKSLNEAFLFMLLIFIF